MILFLWCLGKAVPRNCGVSSVSSLIFEPAYDKTYNKTCATSEDSDQPAHQPNLIRVRCPHGESLGP